MRKEKLVNLLEKKVISLQKIVDKYVFLLVVIIFMTTFATKFMIANAYVSLSADYGQYLRFADIIRGFDVRGTGLRYPPIFPILLSIFLLIFDEITALKVCVAFLYSLIIIPFYFLSKKYSENSIFTIIASCLIAYNYFYSEMMGWGGNANILALAFMIAFLYFWLNSLENGEKRDYFLASLFLSLSVGTHFLLGAYLVIFFTTFFIFSFLNRKQIKFKIIVKKTFLIGFIGLIFSIPYLFYYTYLLNSPVIHETAFSIASAASLEDALNFFINTLFDILIISMSIVGIGISGLKGVKGDKLKGTIIATLFVSACIPLFTQNPVRWLYFWPIPIFLGFIILTESLLGNKKDFTVRKTLIAGAMTFVICISIVSSAYHLQSACSYYNALSKDALDALNWIKNSTPKTSIIASSGPYKGRSEGTGQIYGWWIEGYCDRKCIMTSYLRFLIYEDERNLTEKANIIFSGTDVIINDYVMVAETFGGIWGNPEIGVYIGDFYEKVLLFADNETTFTFSHNSASKNITLSSIENRRKDISPSENGIVITYTDELFNVTKSINVSKFSSSVTVSFNIQHKGNLTKVVIPLLKSDFVCLKNYNIISNKSISLYLTTSMDVYVETDISIDYADHVKTVFPTEHSYYNPRMLVIFLFSTPAKESQIKFKVTLPKFLNPSIKSVEYFDTYEMIKSLQINYILVNKNRIREYEWLSLDTVHFSKEFENGEIAIFKVIPF